MSDYSRVNDFSAKDSLNTGDPDKLIKGSEMDAEFDAARTAINSKPDLDQNETVTGDWNFTGTPTINSASISKIATGSYTGNGAAAPGLAITGLGFQPLLVYITQRITADVSGVNIRWTTDRINDDNTGMSITGGDQTDHDSILSLDADGFTVSDGGGDAAPNADGIVYNFWAIG